jgi:hypothetical protein
LFVRVNRFGRSPLSVSANCSLVIPPKSLMDAESVITLLTVS